MNKLYFFLFIISMFYLNPLEAGGSYPQGFIDSSLIDLTPVPELHFQEDGISYDGESQILSYRNGAEVRTFPAWLSVLPPLIAIVLALVFKEVHIALISGIFFGVFTINGFQFSKFFSSFFQIADTYVIQSIAWVDEGSLQTGHLSIIIFSVLIGGMVHIVSSNGGMNGIVAKVSKLATSARRTQFATLLMGCIIFFDDYANSLVVGNTMRPLTDKFKISREKLSYIVDSTAAPIAAIAFVTTWIGYQLSEIEKGIASQNIVQFQESAYSIFLGSLKYAHYPIFTIFFIVILIYTKKDFGPMLKAEQAAKDAKPTLTENKKEHKTSHWLNATIPVVTLVLTVIVGLFLTGYDEALWTSNVDILTKLRDTFANADSYVSLIWAAFFACFIAIVVSVISKSLDVKESMESMMEGFKSMIPAVVILILAWTLAAVIENLETASYISSLVPENFNAYWLPLIFFVFSAIISFSTGSSWNTMAIMYPICIPIVIKVATVNGTQIDMEVLMPVLLNTVSVILAASVFGDHCSPISDTTILSSLASDCDHIQHVRTQLPYAVVVGLVSIFCGGVLFALGLPWYLLYVIGFVSLYGIIYLFGKQLQHENEN